YQVGLDGLSDASAPGSGPERVLTHYVTGNYFSMLGLRPYLGRLIRPGEGHTPDADPVLVLAYDYWRSRFHGDVRVVGRSVQVNGRSLTVIGVAPRGFAGLSALIPPQIYVPLGMLALEAYPRDFMVNRVLQNLQVAGSLRPGQNIDQAQAELNVVARQLAASYPASDRGLDLRVYRERDARPDPASAAFLRRGGALFLILVGLVMLLACANVGGILAVRSGLRERELAIRGALGAWPGRLRRQLLTENLLLGLLAGAAGLGFGTVASRAVAAVPWHLSVAPRLYFHLDGRVFAFAFGLTVAASLLAGLAPALAAVGRHATGDGPISSSRVTRRGGRWRAALVVAQVAISLILLAEAGQFAKSLWHAQRQSLGFDPQGIMTWTMDPAEIGVHETQGLSLYARLLERVRALPQVEAAALSGSVPMGDYTDNDYLKIERYQSPAGQGLPLVEYNVVSSGYFKALRIPLVAGRVFTDADRSGAQPTAIVNQAFARKYWPGGNPIGQRFAKVSGITNPTYVVVGVAQDSRFAGLSGPVAPYFYLPLEQNYALASQQTLQVRSRGGAADLRLTVERAIHQLEPALPVFNVQSLAAAVDSPNGLLLYRFAAALAALLAGLGLLLASLGVYGVVAHAAAQRTREVGVRVALGARPAEVLALLLREGMGSVGLGILLGLAFASAAARLAAALLDGISPADPWTLASAGLVLLLVALAACYLPARRALRLDPMSALRAE
ncbi:MAG: ADOP family duplicated permease, partial [Terriglobales bacterium]